MQLSKTTLTGYDADGYLEAQVELPGKGGCVPGQAFSPYGFRGRQRDPETDATGEVGRGGHVLYWYDGPDLHTLQLDDCRDTHVPTLKKGGSVQYCAVADGYVLLDGETGAATIKAPTSASVTIEVGDVSIVVADGKVKIGNSGAVPLAKASVVAAALALIKTFASANSANPNVTGASALESGLGALPSPATDIAFGI